MRVKFSGDNQFKLTVSFDSEEERKNLEEDLFNMDKVLAPFNKWIEDPATSKEDANPYFAIHSDANSIISMIEYLFLCAGYTPEQIDEARTLPF